MPGSVPGPYVGPRSFRRQDAEVFFGRDRDVSELEACILAHGEVLLYAQSGAGKTSLINAKLIPNLEKRHFKVMAGARVRGPAVLSDASKVENIYVFHALTSLAPEEDSTRFLTMRLADFLKEHASPAEEEAPTRPHLVIFDQFEEIFTTYPDRWQQRRGFFEQLRDALKADPLLRVLLSMREDHVAEIEPYSPILPEQFRTRFRLERLRRDTAIEAIVKPLALVNGSFEEGVPSRLVTELLQIRYKAPDGRLLTTDGEFVETVQLQVVCETLWNSLRSGERTITHRQLSDVGDVDVVLQKFYESSLAKAVASGGITEINLRAWFEHTLITTAGTRGTVYRGDEDTGGVPNAAVEVLENQHLIRGELRGGATWYELTHDRLIEPIRRSGRDWLIKGKLQALEERAAAWVQGGRGELLLQSEWEEAHKLLESSEARTLGQTGTLNSFVEASRSALDLEDRTQREAWSMFHYFDRSAIQQQQSFRQINLAIVALPLLVIGAIVLLKGAWQVQTSTIDEYIPFKPFRIYLLFPAHIVALVGPIAVAGLLAGMSRFRYGRQWALFRGAAESIKSEIFRYRARTGLYSGADEYVEARFAAVLQNILASLAQSEINRGQISQLADDFPPHYLTRLTGAEYLQTRVEDQIAYFRAVTRRLDRRLRRSQWGRYSICGLATFLAALNWDHLTAIACGALLAWLAADTSDQTEDSLITYNLVLASLLSIKGWWEALSSSERAQSYHLEELVQRTEAALHQELAGWVPQFSAAMVSAPANIAGVAAAPSRE